MMETTKTFPYAAAARRSGYASTLITFIVLCVIEGGLELLLVTVLVPEGWIKVIINVVHTSLMILAIGMMVRALMVLRTSHSLTASELNIHFGPGFKATLPLTTIDSAQQVNEKLPSSMVFGAIFKAYTHRIYAALTPKNLVLLKLAQSRTFRLGLFRKVQAQEILLNFDQPADFLDALAQAKEANFPSAALKN